MGAKTWMFVMADRADVPSLLAGTPPLDREASAAMAARLFPDERLDALADGSLDWTNPPDDELVVGCFPGLCIVAAKEFALDYPSQLDAGFIAESRGRHAYLHAMHSVVDWFAFAHWQNGELQRALSLSPDSGILENIGQPMTFERAFWGGQHPAVAPEDMDIGEEPYPLAFHPLELGDAALRALFGYALEGYPDPRLPQPETVPLLRFGRRPLAPPPRRKLFGLF